MCATSTASRPRQPDARIVPTKRSHGRSASRTGGRSTCSHPAKEPGRIYKLTLDGKIVGMFGESGRDAKQFIRIHGIACPSEDVLFVAESRPATR
jgi:hypothetical protein